MSDGFLVTIARGIEKYFLPACQLMGPFFLPLASLWTGFWIPDALADYKELPVNNKSFLFWLKLWTPWLFFLSLIINSVGAFLGIKESLKKDEVIKKQAEEIANLTPLGESLNVAEESISHLKKEKDDLIYDFISSYLRNLSNNLNLNDSERVSLYLHDSVQGRFILVGRFSKNSDFSKINRRAFPEKEGCIGQTWSNGGEYFVELPSTRATRFKELKKKGVTIDKNVFRILRMESLVYCSFAIEDNGLRIGIILFESTRHGVLEKSSLKDHFSKNRLYFIEMLRKAKATIPSGEDQTER